MSARETVRGLLARAAVATGATALGRRLFPKEGTFVLMGHRVSGDDEGFLPGLDPAWFAAQLDYLCRHYEPIALGRLIACLAKGEAPPRNSFALTFDDGFRDNYLNAFPLLKERGVPATIFLATDCVTRGVLPWSQRLGWIFQKGAAGRLSHPDLGEWAWDPRTEAGRKAGYQRAKAMVRALPRERRERTLDELAAQLAVSPPTDRMLTWGHCREMQAAGVEFGAHTETHSLLALVPEEEARLEMERSRDALREHLGVPSPPFSFPGGSMNERLVAMARKAGFSGLFQSSPWRRINGPGSTGPFSLSRLGLPNAPAAVLEAELDGPIHPVRRWLGGGR